ncbi:hypothetical protein FQN51_007304 [Onygenales sp. PD_10]|nr:hypothetical protein FQN51_007304 [Onygenales sp. PD_10]
MSRDAPNSVAKITPFAGDFHRTFASNFEGIRMKLTSRPRFREFCFLRALLHGCGHYLACCQVQDAAKLQSVVDIPPQTRNDAQS